MTSLEIGLVIISAVLFAALIIVSVLYIRNKKGIEMFAGFQFPGAKTLLVAKFKLLT